MLPLVLLLHVCNVFDADDGIHVYEDEEDASHLLSDVELNLVVNLYANLCLYSAVGCTVCNLSAYIWSYWCSCGVTDCVVSDQGPALASYWFKDLSELVG